MRGWRLDRLREVTIVDDSKLRNDIPVLVVHNIDPRWTDEEVQGPLAEVANLEASIAAIGHPVSSVAVRDPDVAAAMRGRDPASVVVFNWCEDLPGVHRGDTIAARALEDAAFVFTGPSSAVLDACWDKVRVKRVLDAKQIPTPRWRLFTSPRVTTSWKTFPAIVKPAREHCSVGVDRHAVVDCRDDLDRRVSFVIEELGQPAIVEDFVTGRELHVTIWGNGELEILPPAEMDFSALSDVREHVCTWDAKFTPGSDAYEKIGLKIPALLTPAERSALESVCFATFRAFGCRDYARLDVRQQDGVFYVLDVNPNADISSEATAALTAASAGITYGAMISRIVNLAARRHPVFGPAPARRRRGSRSSAQLSLFAD
jgi:D-alanine-D-alanine ligase